MTDRERRRWLAYEVRRLAAAGQSKRQIARSLQIARKTVVALLKHEEELREIGETAVERVVAKRTPRASLLDPYLEKLDGWLRNWSRAGHLESHDNQVQTTILNCLVGAFEAWGGVPREAVTDTMPGVEQYETAVRAWNADTVMRGAHPETGRMIAEMLEEERGLLQPLPRVPYDTRDVFVRVVDRSGYVPHMTNLYSVPDGHVGTRVYACVGPRTVEICDPHARRLREHERFPDGARARTEQSTAVRARGRYQVDALVARIAEWGDIAEQFAKAVTRSVRFAGPEFRTPDM